MRSLSLFPVRSYTFYDGENQDPPAGDSPASPPAGDGKVYTKEEVEKMILDERKRNEDKTKDTIKQLEALRQSQGLTEKEKIELRERIEELTNSMLTKEQLAKKEQEKLANQHKTDVDRLTQERDSWQKRFHESTILRSITDSSVIEGAYNPELVIAVLQNKTRLVEEVDEDGKPTGSYTPRVKFPDVDPKEGKPITLDLTVDQAVKRMKDLPEKYGSLFKSTAISGPGMNGGTGKATIADIKKMTPEQYREFRKTQGFDKV